MPAPVIYWLRNDLRLQDNPALQHALAGKRPLLFVYIHDAHGQDWVAGAASRWWLHHSLLAMQAQFERYDVRLYCFAGSPHDVLPQLISHTGSREVVCSRVYEPAILVQDAKLKTQLAALGASLEISQGNVLFVPGSVRNQQDKAYKVFTPFYKTCLARGLPAEIIPRPKKIIAYHYNEPSLSIAQLHLLPITDWAGDFSQYWQPGEQGAHQRLRAFIKTNLADYRQQRDLPIQDATSHLSAHLHFGELAPQRIIYELSKVSNESPAIAGQVDAFNRQLVWRDFACHILVNFPQTSDEPFQEKFRHFNWQRSNKKLLSAWQKGLTGYPLIDAGMRELWQTGYMHNRVRMIVASFLTKNGLLHWKKGAQWFWDTLVDADLAQNSMNWQWVAGCGVDAAPYFRIFNPVSQSQKFDAEGDYIRRWCPELRALPSKYIHAPWTAPDTVLQQVGIRLERDYPLPILDLGVTRERALQRFKDL